MRNFLSAGIKLALLVTLVFSSVSVFAQVKLRNALDTDGDNRADYVIFRPSNNTWYILKQGGAITQQPFGVANEDFMVPGDYDGDGRGDIAVWRDTTGVWYRLNSASQTFSVQTWGQTGDEPVARDYDGDGRTDLAVVRRSNGVMTWYMYLSGTGSFSSFQFGVATDFTAPGDYDGDGKFEAAVQRPGASPTAEGRFYLRSPGGGFNIIPWGQSNDLVVPGDYDGDGKTDVAVVREGSNPTDPLTWIIRRSSDGSTYTKEWGVAGTDLNAQNDYDGDGKTDLTIWRNSNGRFYVLRSSNGGIDIVSWGQPNDYPVAAYDTH